MLAFITPSIAPRLFLVGLCLPALILIPIIESHTLQNKDKAKPPPAPPAPTAQQGQATNTPPPTAAQPPRAAPTQTATVAPKVVPTQSGDQTTKILGELKASVEAQKTRIDAHNTLLGQNVKRCDDGLVKVQTAVDALRADLQTSKGKWIDDAKAEKQRSETAAAALKDHVGLVRVELEKKVVSLEQKHSSIKGDVNDVWTKVMKNISSLTTKVDKQLLGLVHKVQELEKDVKNCLRGDADEAIELSAKNWRQLLARHESKLIGVLTGLLGYFIGFCVTSLCCSGKRGKPDRYER